MKKIYTAVVFVLFFGGLKAQNIQWQNTIGGSLFDQLYSIHQTVDGGYILGGWSMSDSSGDKTENIIGNFGYADYWIIKTDATGNIQWQNTIGGDDTDRLYSIQETVDGGYILGGFSKSDSSGNKVENSIGYIDYWIVKTDASGNIQWQNNIGGNNEDRLYSIQQTSDGGYVLGGWSNSNISGDKIENSNGGYDYWIVKTDALGNIQWQNTIGGSDDDYLSSIQQTTDGGYILSGYSSSNISGDKTESSNGFDDYWIIKIDSSGNIQWQNTIGGSNLDELYSIQQTSDGGYILGGHSVSNISGDKMENSNGGYDYWIVKTDISGNILWQNTIGGSSGDILYAIQQTANGGYILGGYSGSNISGDKMENCMGGADYWTVKTDSVGNIQWQNTIGGGNINWFSSIQQTADGGYILGGYSKSNISGDKTENSNGFDDYWIVKINDTTITTTIQSAIQNPKSSISISPNPFTNELTITTSHPTAIAEIKIQDIYGRLVYEQKPAAVNRKLQTVNWQQGIYFVEVITEDGRVVRKVVKQ